jgi:uncharacterized protein YndB with AHSA1/START domain
VDHLITRDGRLRVWETFKTSPEDLFSYWTEPGKVQLWWAQEATLEPVPGGSYTYRLAPDNTLSGTFSEVVPGKRLAFSWLEVPGAPERIVVVDFEARNRDTLLTVTQGSYGGGEAEERERQGHLESWQRVLGRLERLVRDTERQKNAR